MLDSHDLVHRLLSSLFLPCRLHVVDVLLENGPDDKGQRCEDQVVEGDVDIVEDGLPWVAAVEGEDELWHREKHVLVEEVQDHLRNTDVVPSPMHQQQTP